MKAVLLAATVALLALQAGAQVAPTAPPPIQSLEATVVNGWLVVVGKVVEFDPNTSVATIAVEETLKGEHLEHVELRLEYREANEAPKWKTGGNRLLISAQSGSTKVVDMADAKLAVLTADLSILHDPSEIVKKAKEIADRTRGSFAVEVFGVTIPYSLVVNTILDVRNGWGFPLTMNVPVDKSLGKWAMDATRSKYMTWRTDGAEALRFFRSDASVARLKELLKDPGRRSAWWPGDGKLMRQYTYPVREAAAQTLRVYWQMPIQQPVVREPEAKNEMVVAVDLGSRKLTAADYQELQTYLNLEDLNLANTEPDLAAVSRLKNLQVLALTNTNVDDAGLKHLAGLKNLIYLDLQNTPVTDEGLKTLAGFKSLKKVDLGQKVTSKGVAELRKRRPDMVVREDEFAFLAPLHLRQVGLPMRQVWAYNVGFRLDTTAQRSYALVFPKSLQAKVYELLESELPKRGWKNFRRPAPPEFKDSGAFSDDEVQGPSEFGPKVSVQPDETYITIAVNPWPRKEPLEFVPRDANGRLIPRFD